MEAFEVALEMGAQMLEMDTRSSLDGTSVIMHDEKVDRTTNGRGKVGEMTLNELRNFRLRNGERVPTLAEVLERFKDRCLINLELKERSMAFQAYDLVSEKDMVSDVLFSSFDGTGLLGLKVKRPASRIALLCEDKKVEMLAVAKRLKAEAIHPKKGLVTPELVEDAHSLNMKVNVWTVNRIPKMKKLIKMGVDGIITDRPELMRKVLRNISCKLPGHK